MRAGALLRDRMEIIWSETMIKDYTDKELVQMAEDLKRRWEAEYKAEHPDEEDDEPLPGDPDYSYGDGWDDGFITGYIQGYRKAQMEEQ